ncbi:hypothetical protein BDB01DRAFT_786972 [Pilobolus umbonatus]|nr:hypothetical protein BDB01DRAFT_786972 [Pilobolus umbonatus]
MVVTFKIYLCMILTSDTLGCYYVPSLSQLNKHTLRGYCHSSDCPWFYCKTYIDGCAVFTAALIFINSLFFSWKNKSTACRVSKFLVAKFLVVCVFVCPDILNNPQFLA